MTRLAKHFAIAATMMACLAAGQKGLGQSPNEDGGDRILPLASKQQMVQDRFQRFQDRVFRLQEQLEEAEPENAQRLARVLEQAGELALADRLDEIVGLLNKSSSWTQAADAQRGWMEDADQLLDILLERDSADKSKQDEIDRLEAYRKSVSELLKREKDLRQAAANAAASRNTAKQIDQALKRVDALLQQQGELSQATQLAQGGDKGNESRKELGASQKDLARETERLAEDLKKIAAQQKAAAAESASEGSAEGAEGAIAKASQSAEQGAKAMGDAEEKIQKDELDSAGEKQQDAEKRLRETRDALEEAKKILKMQQDLAKQASEQRKVAKDTEALSDQMKADGSKGQQSPGGQQGEQGQQQQGQQGQQGQKGEKGQQGQSGQQQGGQQGEQQQQQPGEENVERAQEEMERAADALDKEDAPTAGKNQDRAIEELQKAQQQLDEVLNQLREEEREEMLRDLEMRFREMVAKQKAINAETIVVDDAGAGGVGGERFKRSEKLQLADLSARQRSLSQDAAKCAHILEEEGSTIAFPRVVAQLAIDMTTVAERLASFRSGVLTQTIQEEIIDTLAQLLDAVKKMQEENEQQGDGKQGGGDQDPPLLPNSAELKLLRSSQQRVNSRTEKIEWARIEQIETDEELGKALAVTAKRQADCATIAKEMRDRLGSP